MQQAFSSRAPVRSSSNLPHAVHWPYAHVIALRGVVKSALKKASQMWITFPRIGLWQIHKLRRNQAFVPTTITLSAKIKCRGSAAYVADYHTVRKNCCCCFFFFKKKRWISLVVIEDCGNWMIIKYLRIAFFVSCPSHKWISGVEFGVSLCPLLSSILL